VWLVLCEEHDQAWLDVTPPEYTLGRAANAMMTDATVLREKRKHLIFLPKRLKDINATRPFVVQIGKSTPSFRIHNFLKYTSEQIQIIR
jgi:hypothetical protein